MREGITEWQYLRGPSVKIREEEGTKKASKDLFTSLQVSTLERKGKGRSMRQYLQSLFVHHCSRRMPNKGRNTKGKRRQRSV